MLIGMVRYPDRLTGPVVEVERTVSKVGTVSLGQRLILAAAILGGRRVGIYIEEGAPLLFFDPETRELLRTRPNPLEPGEAVRLQRTRSVGTLPHPSTEPIRVQRRANNSGVITVTGQKVALGREHTYRTVTVHVSETTLAIELPDADTRVVRRTTTQPVRSIKAQRPRTADTSVSRPCVAHQLADTCRGSTGGSQGSSAPRPLRLLPKLLPDGLKSGRSGRHCVTRRFAKPQLKGTIQHRSSSMRTPRIGVQVPPRPRVCAGLAGVRSAARPRHAAAPAAVSGLPALTARVARRVARGNRKLSR
jgi:hypothetical protein